jgi:electron transport complex protein RnfB
VRPLDQAHGREGPRGLAVIDEALCIGCTLCIQACPVDCIVGAPRRMHTVIDAQCTGCELCVPACPVDCIAMQSASGALTGWAAWSEEQASAARRRYAARKARKARAQREQDERLARHAVGADAATAPQGDNRSP